MNHSKYALLATVLLAACGAEPSGDAASTSPDSALQAPSAAGDTSDSTSRGSSPQQGPAVVLAPDGLTLGAGAGAGAPKRLAFGGAQAGVLADVNAALGAPEEQGVDEECGAGPLFHAQYASGLHVVFQNDEFVGWTAPQGSSFRTAQGIGPGSSLGELKKAYRAATVQETSLGQEFAAGDLYGVLTGPSDTATVEIMFAGTDCIFR